MRQDRPLVLSDPKQQRIDFPFQDDEDSIDVRALLKTVWRRKLILIVCILIGGLLAYLVTSQLEPRYQASAKMIFNSQASNVVDVGQAVAVPVAGDNLQNEMQVLQSTRLIERVVDELDLTDSQQFNPFIREREPGFLEWAATQVTLPPELADMAYNLGLLEPPELEEAPLDPEEVERFHKRVVVANVKSGLGLVPVQNSQVLNISYTSANPRTSALIVNTLADLYIIDQLDSKLEATRTATEWLSTRVDELQVGVQEAEEAVEVARAVQSAEAGQSLEITQQQLAALTATLSNAKNEASFAETTYERLRDAILENRDYGAISAFRASSLIQSFRESQEQLLSQRANLLSSVDEEHPTVVRIDAQLAEITSNIDAEANRIVEATRSDWLVAQERQADLEAEVRDLEDKALEQSKQAVAIRQLEREAQARRTLYENFLSRQKETSAQEDLQTPDARVLTPAEIPFGPLTTTVRRTQAMGLIAGALVGFGLIFLLEKLNNSFRSSNQLEDMVGLPVLGSVPAVGKRLSRAKVVRRFLDKPKSSLAEAIRSLRTSILFSNVDNPPKVVLFTSSLPREGKSTTALLMAMTSQQMGRSSIIVDCDLRLPALARVLATDDKKPGLLSLIEGTASLEEAITTDPDTGTKLLMTKPSEPRSSVNAADLLSSKRFENLIKELSETYDRVILDAPPALVVADAKILSAYADAVVFAVRWDHTPHGAVLDGIKDLKSVNAPVAGTVLTLVNEKRAARYAYESYGYYRGRYKDYYIS